MPPVTNVRDAVYDLLVAPGHSWGDRVFSPDSVEVADRDQTPFLTLLAGPEDPGAIWGGRAQMLYIGLYAPVGSGSGRLDELRDEVVGVLDQQNVDTASESFDLAYDGVAGQDVTDNDWRLPTRLLRFWATPARDKLDDTSEPLPTLRGFTANTLAGVQVDRATANPSDASPFVYWRRARLMNVDTRFANGGRFLVEYEFHAHIVAPGRAARRDATQALADALVTVDRWFLLQGDGRVVRFTNIAADSEIDPRRAGQVVLRAEVELERILGPMPPFIVNTPIETVYNGPQTPPAVIPPGTTDDPTWPGFRVLIS